MRADLVCVGYLAHADIATVTAYPPVNSGAPVTGMFTGLAGDAPIAALTASGLGTTAHLIGNRVGHDPAGRAVLDRLHTAGVTHDITPDPGVRTPQVTIVADQAGNRTWFAWLHTAPNQLATADLTPLATAGLVYIDCYQLIQPAAIAAIGASRAPLLLNLGGDPLSEALTQATRHRHVAFVQTNLDEHHADHAEHLAADLFTRLAPETVVITLGSLGALGYTPSGSFRVQAPAARIRHTHGAGAAFSGALAHSYLHGATARQAIQAACRIATTHCATDPEQIPHQRPTSDIMEAQP